MSDLQIALIVIGAVVLVAVIAYNQWQERQLRKRADKALASEHADALLDTPAIDRRRAAEAAEADDEPEAEAPAPAAAAPASPPAPDVEHTLGLPPVGKTRVPDEGVGPVLDPRLDFIATLVFGEARSGEEILRLGNEMLPATRQVNWEGRPEEGGWATIVPAGDYVEARCGLQLVDRRGVASEQDVVAFSQAVQSLAATLNAQCDFAGRGEALRNATELDQLCADVDIQVGLNIVKTEGAAIPATKVRTIAEIAGCALAPDGAFRLKDSSGAEVLAVTNLEGAAFALDNLASLNTRGVSVTLDVPRAPPTGEAFNQFANFATSLAKTVGGEVVDDNRRPIAQAAMVAIAQHVAGARLRMHEAGIPAGSPLALRLFS